MKEKLPAKEENNDVEKLMQSLILERDCRWVDIRLTNLKVLLQELCMEFKGTVAFSVSFGLIAMIAVKMDVRVMAYIAMTAALLGLVHLASVVKSIRKTKRAWDKLCETLTGGFVPSEEE